MPYSHTVNVGRALVRNDILRDQSYVDGQWGYTICDWDGRNISNCQNKTSATRPQTGFSQGNSRVTYNVAFQHNGSKTVAAKASSWATSNSNNQSVDAFRTSGNACIEERPSVGNAASPVRIATAISRADADTRATGSSDAARQFGRYDPGVQRGHTQDGCPSEAQKLASLCQRDGIQRRHSRRHRPGDRRDLS